MKVLLIDDHSLFRAGLRLLTQSIRPGTHIYEASCIAEGIDVAHQQPDIEICLLDIHLAKENGLDGIQQLKACIPSVAIVVVSSETSSEMVSSALDAGAMAFIPKSSTPTELSTAIQRVLDGELYIPQQAFANRTEIRPSPPVMSKRQWDVFHALMRGLPNKLICRELDLSENTVKSHIAAIFRIFDVHTRTQLLIAASKLSHIPRPRSESH